MKTIFHPANERGFANHGWLQAAHSFSFANFYDPAKVQFGALRVLNDDIIAADRGFGMHPHDNMEIITIPLHGALRHEDSMGHSAVIKAGEIQVMSAGTGILHSEHNASETESINLLQIWLFPNKRNVTPRYDQQLLNTEEQNNNWAQILSPNENDAGVWIHQNAWFHLGKFNAGATSIYKQKDLSNGIYVFVIEGEVEVNGQKLAKRDALGITEQPEHPFNFLKDSHVLIMEIPLA